MRRITLLTNPDVCNLHCPLCFLQQRGRPFGMGEMPFEVASAAILKYLDDLEEVIPSTMGEPLLYTEFLRLLDFCSGRRVLLNLTTNGTFPGIWGGPAEKTLLLQTCSDIKISGLAFENKTMVQGKFFDENAWKKNVEQLLECRKSALGRRLAFEKILGPLPKTPDSDTYATVSLQMTLHRKNVHNAENILRWAESIGVHRIKWNPVVFLSEANPKLTAEYAPDEFDLDELRKRLVSNKLKCEGSLFFKNKSAGEGTSVKERLSGCSFRDEVWILPDGSEQYCPNPERRFGNPQADSARCDNCVMSPR